MNRMCRGGMALIAPLLVLGLTSALARADGPDTPQKVATVEGITEYRLSNGLRVLLFPDSSTPKVTVNLTVFVGSRHEGYGETGMAHLLEHMVFKGTPKMPDVNKELRDHGADFNGSTWVDRTNYYETFDGTDENLEFGIRLEADRLVNSFIKREDLASEMTVVRNEFEQGENSPTGVLMQRMRAVAFEWHNYGKSTIGNRSDIERVPIDKLQAFYKKHYQPDNCLLVLAGKFDPAKALGYVTKYFGALKNPDRQLDATYTDEPPQDGERSVVLRRVGTVGAVGVVYHIPAGSHPDYAPLEVLSEMLTMQPSGRLYQALVTTKKATRVNGSPDGFHDPGLLEFMAQVDRTASVEAVRDTMLDVLEKLPKEKFTEEEVERARRRLLKQIKMGLNDPNQIGIDLSEWAAMGDWRMLFINRDRLEKVAPADVQRVAKEYLVASNRTVGMFIPTEAPVRAKVPPTPKIDDLVKNYIGGKGIVQGEELDPTVENIQKRLQMPVLPCGVKAALLPKKTRGEKVLLTLTLHYGNPESLKGQQGPAHFLASLMARGTKKHNRQQLADELDKLNAVLSPSNGTGELEFDIECDRENLPKVLALLQEVLREPTFPADEFEVLKRQSLESLQRSLKEPSALASRALQRILGPYPKDDVRYTPTFEEGIARIEATTVDQVKKLYESQLGGTVGELVVIGDFDPAPTLAQVQKLLDGWKSAVAFQRIDRTAKTDIKGETVVIETPDKKNAFFFAAELLAMKDTDPDYAALELGNYLLGNPNLVSRLGYRVREKEGLSYGVGSQFSADEQDLYARFMMYAICNPDNIGKVDKAMKEELDKVLKDGISEDELADGKKAFLAELKVNRSDDANLAAVLSSELFAGRTFAFTAEFEKKVAALTVADVNKALRKIDPKRLVIIRAGDFQGSGAPK